MSFLKRLTITMDKLPIRTIRQCLSSFQLRTGLVCRMCIDLFLIRIRDKCINRMLTYSRAQRCHIPFLLFKRDDSKINQQLSKSHCNQVSLLTVLSMLTLFYYNSWKSCLERNYQNILSVSSNNLVKTKFIANTDKGNSDSVSCIQLKHQYSN